MPATDNESQLALAHVYAKSRFGQIHATQRAAATGIAETALKRKSRLIHLTGVADAAIEEMLGLILRDSEESPEMAQLSEEAGRLGRREQYAFRRAQ